MLDKLWYISIIQRAAEILIVSLCQKKMHQNNNLTGFQTVYNVESHACRPLSLNQIVMNLSLII